MAGLLIYLLLKLVLEDTLPGYYQFALKDWDLIIKLFKKQLNSNISLITTEDANFRAASSKNTNPSRDSQSFNTAHLSSQPTRDQRKCDQHPKHPGFFNKWNTCCASSILQALSTIPSLWCQSASKSGFLSPLTKAMSLNMSLLMGRTTCLDPSNFLWALCRKLSTNTQVPFQFNTQQDALRSFS